MKEKSYNFHFHKNNVTWPLSANGLVLTFLVWWLIRRALFQPFLIFHPGECLKQWQHFFVFFCLLGKTVDCQSSDTVFGLDQLTKGSVDDFIWTIPYDSNYKRIALKISKHQRWKTTVPQLKYVHSQGQNPLTKKSDRFHNHCNLLTLLEQSRMGIGLPIKSPEILIKSF